MEEEEKKKPWAEALLDYGFLEMEKQNKLLGMSTDMSQMLDVLLNPEPRKKSESTDQIRDKFSNHKSLRLQISG